MFNKRHLPLWARHRLECKRLWGMAQNFLNKIVLSCMRGIWQPGAQYRLTLLLAALLSFSMAGALSLPTQGHAALHFLSHLP